MLGVSLCAGRQPLLGVSLCWASAFAGRQPLFLVFAGRAGRQPLFLCWASAFVFGFCWASAFVFCWASAFVFGFCSALLGVSLSLAGRQPLFLVFAQPCWASALALLGVCWASAFFLLGVSLCFWFLLGVSLCWASAFVFGFCWASAFLLGVSLCWASAFAGRQPLLGVSLCFWFFPATGNSTGWRHRMPRRPRIEFDSTIRHIIARVTAVRTSSAMGWAGSAHSTTSRGPSPVRTGTRSTSSSPRKSARSKTTNQG